MPSVRPSENENEFISRCMADNKMKSEYPSPDQRYAVCVSYWRRR